jgi:hypothetical protein
MFDTYTINDTTELRVFYDEDSINPRKDWDNMGTMVCFHRRYNLGDQPGTEKWNKHNFTSPEEFKDYVKENINDIAVILPLYLYDHSGITMNTTGFHCPWDSGQVGCIYVTKEDVRKWFGIKRITKKVLKQVEECLKSEVETYDQYITGNVYGYQLVQKSKCKDCGNTEWETIDSCWGFFGNDFKSNGLLENLSVEDRKKVEEQL